MLKKEPIHKICVLGDSVLKGVVLDESSGKYTFLKQDAVKAFAESHPLGVVNYSRFGSTVGRGMEKLKQVLRKEPDFDAALLEFGGNDCDYNWDEVAKDPGGTHQPNTPHKKFKDTLVQMIELLLSAGKRPFVMNLPPIDYKMYFNWISRGDSGRAKSLLSFLGDKSLIYRHQEYYSRMVEAVAQQYKLFVVNVRDAFLPVPRLSECLCADGIHPNEKGHVLIERTFSDAYREAFESL